MSCAVLLSCFNVLHCFVLFLVVFFFTGCCVSDSGAVLLVFWHYCNGLGCALCVLCHLLCLLRIS